MSAVLACLDCRAAWQKTRDLPLFRDKPSAARRLLLEAYFTEYHRLDHDAARVVEEIQADLQRADRHRGDQP